MEPAPRPEQTPPAQPPVAGPSANPAAARPAPAVASSRAGATLKPDATHPDTAQPDATHPDATHPDATHPDTAHPDAAQPDATRPTATRPDRTDVPAAPPRLTRGEERSPRDMIMSLAVLIVPIALLLIFYRMVLSGDAPVTVDPAATVQEAQRAAAFTVAVPTGLSDDWHVIGAKFSRQEAGATLRLGYVDPDDDGVQLVESSVPPDTLLPTELGASAKALGNYRTPAGVWRVYDGRPGETAIVLAEPTRTIIVVGRTDVANLQELASSLR